MPSVLKAIHMIDLPEMLETGGDPDFEVRTRFRKASVYVDCNSFGPRAIEAAVDLYGAERIVCGTDGSEFGCDWTRKALADARISEEAREQILHRNAAAMLARVAKSAQHEQAVA